MTWIPDATALSDFSACAEKFRSRHRLHLVKARELGNAADAGRAWHAALAIWFSNAAAENGTPLSLLDSATAALIAAWGEEPLFLAAPLKRPRGLYEALLRVYAEKWPRERDGFEVVRNEEWVEGMMVYKGDAAPLMRGLAIDRDPFRYGGIVDRLIRLDGHVYVMDSKTTSANLSDAYFAQYALSDQMRGYVALELVNGRDCEGVYIDAVHVDTRGQKAKPEHCLRYGPIRYRQDQLSAWARDTEWRLRQIQALDNERGATHRWLQNPASCWRFNTPCEYFERCCVAEELADTMPGYTTEEWRPQERTHERQMDR